MRSFLSLLFLLPALCFADTLSVKAPQGSPKSHVLISGDVSFDGKNIPGLSVVVTDSYGKKDTVVTKDDGTFVLTLQDDKTAKHLVEVYWGGKKLLYRHWVVVFSGIPTMHVNLH